MAPRTSVSRRTLLKHAAAAAAAGGAAMVGATPASAQAVSQTGGNFGPNMAGRKFRAVVSTGFGANTTKIVDDLTLLPISGRQVVVQPKRRSVATRCVRASWARRIRRIHSDRRPP